MKAANTLNQRPVDPLLCPLDVPRAAQLTAAVAGLAPLQLAWVSGYLAGLAGVAAPARTAAEPASTHELAPAAETETAPVLTILYGSQTGHARGLAERLAGLARTRGTEPRLLSMGDYRPRDLARERLLLIVVSTQGEGEPPESARELHAFLHGKRAPRLEGLRYAVLGLGDSSYQHFCQTAREFDERLGALGGRPLLGVECCDVDYQDAAAAWSQQALERSAEHLGQREARIIQLPGTRPAAAAPAVAAPTAAQGESAPHSTRLLERRPLTTENAAGEVQHLVLGIDPQGLSYTPGDALGVWFQNDPALVEAVLAAVGLPGETALTLDGAATDLREALTARLELTQLHPRVVKAWAQLSGSEPLAALTADPERLRAYAGSRQFIDLVTEHPGRPVPGALAGLLLPLRPRLYSIACSQAETPDEVHLTVARLGFEVGGQAREGAASGFLTRRLAEDAELKVLLSENPAFRLPADADTPVIMVAAGTGVAPFRAFMQQRAAVGDPGRNWLIFGNRHFRRDFLYQLDWQAHRKAGLLTRVSVAFSRDQADKRYVQHRIAEQGRDLWAWLAEGAHLYVCGSTAMGRAVHEALLGVIAREAALDPESAALRLEDLRRAGRYQRDLY